MAIGREEFEEIIEVIVFDVGVDQFFALAIHDADVHLVGVKVDSAIELSGGCIVFHSCYQSGAVRHRLVFVGECSLHSPPD